MSPLDPIWGGEVDPLAHLCTAAHLASSGATWRCHLPKFHPGGHDDGCEAADSRWNDVPESPPAEMTGRNQVTFRDNGTETAVYVGEQRVVRIPNGDHQTLNAIVDVVEALGFEGTRLVVTG